MKLALCGAHHIWRIHEWRLYIIFLAVKSISTGATWMAAYKETFFAKGFNKGFNSCAPAVVIAWCVDQASNVAALCSAMASPSHRLWLRRFSSRSSLTLTVSGLARLRNAVGAPEPTTGRGS